MALLTLAFSSIFLAFSAVWLIFSSLTGAFSLSAASLRNSILANTEDGSVFSEYLVHGESLYDHTLLLSMFLVSRIASAVLCVSAGLSSAFAASLYLPATEFSALT